MPVDRLIETRKETARGMTETPRGTGHTNTTEETGTRVGGSWMTTKIGSQQKQSPEEGITEGGPIPLHRDTTIYKHTEKEGVTHSLYGCFRASRNRSRHCECLEGHECRRARVRVCECVRVRERRLQSRLA